MTDIPKKKDRKANARKYLGDSNWRCIRCKGLPKTYTYGDSGYFLKDLCEYCFDDTIDIVRKRVEKEREELTEKSKYGGF